MAAMDARGRLSVNESECLWLLLLFAACPTGCFWALTIWGAGLFELETPFWVGEMMLGPAAFTNEPSAQATVSSQATLAAKWMMTDGRAATVTRQLELWDSGWRGVHRIPSVKRRPVTITDKIRVF
jgi:hypothetical protein